MATVSLLSDVRSAGARLIPALSALKEPDAREFDPDKGDKADFLLELKVLYELLVALANTGWKIGVENRQGRIRFVRKPGNKSTATFFRIEKASLAYQVVHGTKIRDRYGEKRAPDISLQRGSATMDPGPGDSVAIWDAKLRGTTGSASEKEISDSEFRNFLKVREWLDVPDVPASGVPLAGFPPAFEVSGIITNGRRPTEPPQLFFDESVSVVEQYTGPNTPTQPRRVEHIAAATKTPTLLASTGTGAP